MEERLREEPDRVRAKIAREDAETENPLRVAVALRRIRLRAPRAREPSVQLEQLHRRAFDIVRHQQQVAARRRMRRLQRHRAFERRDRLVDPQPRRKGARLRAKHFGPIRSQRESALTSLERAVRIGRGVEGARKAKPATLVRRIELAGPSQLDDRVLGPSRIKQGDAIVVARPRQPWLDLHRAAEMMKRLVAPARLHEEQRENLDCLEILRLQAKPKPNRRQRLVDASRPRVL